MSVLLCRSGAPRSVLFYGVQGPRFDPGSRHAFRTVIFSSAYASIEVRRESLQLDWPFEMGVQDYLAKVYSNLAFFNVIDLVCSKKLLVHFGKEKCSPRNSLHRLIIVILPVVCDNGRGKAGVCGNNCLLHTIALPRPLSHTTSNITFIRL